MNYFKYQTAIGSLTFCEEEGNITVISSQYQPETGEEK